MTSRFGRKRADAHLISAALEMQSALRAVLTDPFHKKRGVPGMGPQAEQMVRSALAKSNGKA